MTPQQEIELFARLAADQRFEAWLAEQQAENVKYLIQSLDPVAIHRAQGASLLIEKMTKLLARGKTLR
jgi:hypothetical protein